MKPDTISFIALASAAVGAVVCITVGVATLHQPVDRKKACDLLNIAQDEAQMAEAWHIQAGEVLQTCGINGAMRRATEKACAARRFNGSGETCE